MDIEEIRTYPRPNIFSLKKPVVKMKVRLGDYADIPTKDIKGLNEGLLKVFPGISRHACSTGYEGGFLDRLKEGTYLAHVMEHLCIEIQNMLGYPIKYGKARQVSEDLYNVIYTCQQPVVGIECGRFVINVLNRLLSHKEFEFYKEFEDLRKTCIKNNYGPSTAALVEGALRRGIPVNDLGDSGILRLGYGKYQKYLSATLYEGTSSTAVDIACDKALTKFVLAEMGVPIPDGRICTSLEDVIKSVQELGYPLVVKPKSGNHGKNVFIGINTEDELKEAFRKASAAEKEVLLEKYIKGRDYRILVVHEKVVAVAERIPAHVIGDGVHSVEQLIEITNKDINRGEDHEKPLTRIKLDEELLQLLEKQRMKLSSIPEKEQCVWLRETANISTGGIAIDRTGEIHPANKAAAELAAKTIGLDIAGIDMVIPDISQPIGKDYGAIVEVNAAPGIRMHLYPSAGSSRDVVSPILDMIYPKDEPYSIPIISITGTNGKTTTTRMIGNILMQSGYRVGMTTTHGIYIGNVCIEEGDTTGPRSARRILFDRSVEAAVLETARGGIVREGLAYEKADIAVFTNLTKDHLGIDEIDTMEDLLQAKSLVIEAVKEDGFCVLNADDPWVMKAKEKAKGNIILFSLRSDNSMVVEHLKKGGCALYLRDNSIFVSCKGMTMELMEVGDIPAAMNGVLRHNIYNSLAAIGAASAAGIPFNTIRKALGSFRTDAQTNPGRFNVYEIGPLKVVLDYGHNSDGYRVTIEGLMSLKRKRLIGVIGVPGDRRNEDIRRLGQIAGMAFDRIIIKEDRDLRGRKPLEVAGVLMSGVLETGFARDKVEIIPDEVAALEKVLSQAEEEDVIAVFFEKMEPLVSLIQRYSVLPNMVGSEERLPLLV